MFARTILAIHASILLIIVSINAAPLMFPLTLGGFTSDTIIQRIVFTGNQKILIAAITTDPSIIDTTTFSIGNFLAYFDYQNTKDYLWSKQYYFVSSTLEGFG
jgi:hypothetical protein